MSHGINAAPFFSVVVPLYNKSAYVTRAIRSIKLQSDQNFELIVVDDGSTDASASIAEEEISDDPRCVVIRQINRGAGETRNAGLRRAVGEWIAFLDADDMWAPSHLTELRSIIESCPAAKMVATNFVEINEGQEPPDATSKAAAPSYCNYFLVASLHPGRVNSSNVCIHTSVPSVSGWFGNARSGQDLEYWARVALDHPVALSPRKTTIYYRGNWGNMEKLAHAGTNHSVRIQSLADVSASLGLLENRWLEDSALASRSDIRAYVNGRLDNAIRMQFVRGNFDQLSILRELKFRSTNFNSMFLSLLTYAPTIVLSNFRKRRGRFKRALAIAKLRK